MKSSDFEEISDSDIKNHSEILQIIDEIRVYEQNFVDFNSELVEDKKDIKKDLIEVDHEKNISEDDESIGELNNKKFSFLKKTKENEKTKVPTTFKIGFDEDGKLVNLDLKKPKPKKDDASSKKKFSVKSLLPKRKKENEETKDDGSKSSKLKKGLGKLSKLKRVIPSKNKSSEETKK